MIGKSRWLATAIVMAQAFATTAIAGLRDDVDRLVRGAALKGASISISIRECGSGNALVSINADAPMAPASNMKLLTSGAALHAMGPEFQFTTRLLRDGDRLIIVGDGDPGFGDPELLTQMTLDGKQGLDAEAFLNLWIKPVVDSGITNVREVVVDDRIFEREFVQPTWPIDQLNNRYCAQVAGLNFHANVLHFYPRPRKGESPLIGDSNPEAPWFKIINNASCRDGQNDKNDSWIARKLGTNELTFHGNVRFPSQMPIPVTIHDVPDFFAHVIAERLTRHGISVGGYRVALKDDPVSSGQSIGPAITTPISTVLRRCNTDSENLYAECLLKRTGHAMTGEPGSWVNGTAILRHILHDRLDDPTLLNGVIVADGSGLSADNRITAGMMTAWLNSFHNDSQLGPVFIGSLAVAGQSGTLENRMGSVKTSGALVQAKTGYINQVSCLSGFVTMPDGRRRCFSILVNGLKPGTVPLAKKMQDQIVTAIAQDFSETVATASTERDSSDR